ncbi:hypothetical protein GW17_00048264, partial [Ensete ventricosum]
RWRSIEGEIDRRQLIEGEIDRQRSIEEEKGKKKKRRRRKKKRKSTSPARPRRPRVGREPSPPSPPTGDFSPRVGREIEATLSLLYGAEDPSIAGMVLDSAFSNLYDLMMELVDVYKIRLPKFTGDKNIIKFEGDHNSSRPQFYYDSVSIFFYNVLQPPQIPSSCTSNFQRYYDLGELKAGAGTDEVISCIFLLETNYGRKKKKILVKEIILDFLVDEDNMITNMGGNSVNESNLQVTHFVSYSSSILLFQMTLRALATPLRRIQRKSSAKPKNKKKGTVVSKKPKREKLEKGETLSQRLRLCILGRANHRRHRST